MEVIYGVSVPPANKGRPVQISPNVEYQNPSHSVDNSEL